MCRDCYSKKKKRVRIWTVGLEQLVAFTYLDLPETEYCKQLEEPICYLFATHLNEIDVWKSLDEILYESAAERSCTRGDLHKGPQRQGACPCGGLGPEQRRHDGRHEWQVRDLVPVDGTDGLADVEPVHDDDGGAERKEADGEEGEAVDVEHGQRGQVDIVASRSRVLGHLEAHEELDHGDEVAVREHDALAPAAGPRRVEHGGGVILADLRRRELVTGAGTEQRVEGRELFVRRGGSKQMGHEDDGCAGEGRELRDVVARGEDEARAGFPDAVGDLGGAAVGVHRGGDGAGGEHGEEGDGEGDGVGEDEEHDRAGTDAVGLAEAMREGGDEAAEVGAGEGGAGRGVAEEEGMRGRVEGEAGEEVGDEGEAGVGGERDGGVGAGIDPGGGGVEGSAGVMGGGVLHCLLARFLSPLVVLCSCKVYN